MDIAVFGLGYVGCVSAACLAAGEHSVVGVDVDDIKLSAIQQGQSPIVEKGLAELIQREVVEGRLRATSDACEAVGATQISFVCVGTPSRENGSLDLRYTRRVAEQIGDALRAKDDYHVVVFRSTMLPGSVDRELIPLLEEHSGKRAGADFGVAYNPEFLRESTAIFDFHNPPRTLVGALDQRSGDLVERIYVDIEAPFLRTSIRTAEMVKYVDNAFHALKTSFANEIGTFCKSEGLDSHEVMDIFCLDTKLNLAPTYLKPGAAFGGSCLPKDLRALVQRGRSRDLQLPLLDAIAASNEHQKRTAFDLIVRQGKTRVGVLGLSFKAGTDDLRESPTVELVEALIGKGYQLSIYDRNVSLSAIFGSNRAYIEREIPHIASLMRSTLDDVVDQSDVLVIANRDPDFYDLGRRLRDDQVMVDLVRVPRDPHRRGSYVGIAW